LRFAVVFKTDNRELPIDYRRKFISFLKKSFEEYDKKVYEKFYKDRDNIEKEYTFSVYLGKCKVTKEKIVLENDEIILNFSTYDTETGLHFYNAMLGSKDKKFDMGKNNFITPQRINLLKEKILKEDRVLFKTFSPIVIREHMREGNRDKFYTFKDDGGIEVIKKNMKYSLEKIFGESVLEDIDNLKINDVNTKTVSIRNYDINIPCTLGMFEMEGERYLLDYFYKAGFSSKKSAGFGMLEIVV
jgi:CRISPR-associated endoribonuclease Cas6